MKIQNNVFGKSQDYNTTMPPQEKRQLPEAKLKEVLDKKIHNHPTMQPAPKYSTNWLCYQLLQELF